MSITGLALCLGVGTMLNSGRGCSHHWAQSPALEGDTKTTGYDAESLQLLFIAAGLLTNIGRLSTSLITFASRTKSHHSYLHSTPNTPTQTTSVGKVHLFRKTQCSRPGGWHMTIKSTFPFGYLRRSVEVQPWLQHQQNRNTATLSFKVVRRVRGNILITCYLTQQALDTCTLLYF